MDRWIERAGEPETHDDTPVEIPVSMTKPESMEEMMARLIAERIASTATAQGFDTWEEDEDFEDEDPDLLDFTPYELNELQEHNHLPAEQGLSGTDEAPDDPWPPETSSETGPQGPPNGSAQRAVAPSPEDTQDADSVGKND